MAKASFIFMGMGDENFHMGFEADNRWMGKVCSVRGETF
jgi:hypothetical protein